MKKNCHCGHVASMEFHLVSPCGTKISGPWAACYTCMTSFINVIASQFGLQINHSTKGLSKKSYMTQGKV